MNKIKPLFQGIAMGIAEIVPGISASTATLLLGIYDDFINLLDDVTNFLRDLLLGLIKKKSKKEVINSFKNINLIFAILLFLGMGLGIVLFSNIIDLAYEKYETNLKAIFFGIILSSLLIPLKKINLLKPSNIISLILGFIAFYSVLDLNENANFESIPLWLVFIGGAISVTGMVLPGVNSSFLLIPLGIYELILNIVSEFSKLNFEQDLIIQAIVFALGLATGVIVLVKLLKYAFKKHLDVLLSMIAGIMIASLFGVSPFVDTKGTNEVLVSVLLVLISSLVIGLFIKKTNPEKEFEK